MTIPQFTPDGRLLQVEYASRAPEQSGPLVAVPVWSNDGDEENERYEKNECHEDERSFRTRTYEEDGF